ncbi:MAG TPA: hydroxyethylthiazole kinase [Longimicrobium sp.]|nr:hydroxyethylthiazole kinase [Longimicrobium sp.]
MSNDNGHPWRLLARLREQSPLVHCITNYVAMDVTANALLALGAAPAMVHSVEEVEEFVGISSALLINIGTLSPPWVEAMMLAADRAASLGKPWVLDPVGAGATAYRTRVAGELARRGPACVRGNASEILALAGASGRTRGVDSTQSTDEARDAAAGLARELGCLVAVTGEVDYVTDGASTLAIRHGHPLMTRVTALGCALSATTAAFLAVERTPLSAASALALFGMAGEDAAEGAPGPGTFRVRMIDNLHALDPASTREARIAPFRDAEF